MLASPVPGITIGCEIFLFRGFMFVCFDFPQFIVY
jgi:hypothetical protein